MMDATEPHEPAHRVHGLAGDEIAPDWPPITASELERLFAHYPALGKPRSIRWHSPRPLSAAALVESDRGTVFVKRHHEAVRSPATLAEEHAFGHWLRARDIPVPAVFASHEGDTALALEGWTWEIHAPAAGRDLYRQSPSWTPLHDLDHARAAGEMLGKLHLAAHGYSAKQRGTHLLVARSELIEAPDPIATLGQQLAARPALAGWLQARDWQRELDEAIGDFQPKVQARAAAQPRLWAHGDWHASNLFWNGNGTDATVSAVLDFGLCARTFALFDLATAIERNTIAWLQTDPQRGHPTIARALIDGYRQVLPLEAADLALLADLLPVVHLDFALSEIDYFAGITRKPKHALIAWRDFLIGHAHWFRSRPGREFLDALGQA